MPRRKLTEEEKEAARIKREAKKKAELEKRIERNLQDHKKRYLKSFTGYPPESRKFEVGDEVEYGATYKAVVTEVHDGGRVYRLNITSRKKKRKFYDSDEYEYEYSKEDQYVKWVSITPKNDNKTILCYRDDLQITYSQRHIYSLLLCSYEFGIDDEVDYQRGNVWSYGDKVALIDSIFNNVDIGKFVLIHKPYRSKNKLYEILDGKQRLNALLEFHQSRFKWNGKYFHELSKRDQDHFEQYQISWGEVHSNMDEEVPNKYKYEYFLKLNTSGHVVEKAHLNYVRGLLENEKSEV